MSRTNCPNCGAPITPNAKCEYCGTYFFDIAHIPFHEPFYLSLNIGTEQHPNIVVSKVYTSGCKVTLEPVFDSDTGRDINGALYRHRVTSCARYEFEFISIGDVCYEKHPSI